MSHIRAMFVGQGPSGLPEDRVVNVFHFLGLGTYEEDQADVVAAVANFYTGARTNATVGGWLSPWVSRAAQIVTYDLLTAKPRVPTASPITLGGSSADGMPEEVACCVSWLCAPPLTRRRRGRTYIGPLGRTAITPATTTTPARPAPSFQQDLLEAAVELIDFLGPTTVFGLQVNSTATPNPDFPGTGVMHRVVQAYVDNALDTQRRRGPKTTARTFAFTV